MRRYSEVLSVCLLILIVFLFFSKSILGGLPVSKLYLLANRDLLFSQFRDIHAFMPSDQSLYLLAAPNFFTVAHCWRDGIIPLWNPYIGMGMPEIGDLQSCIFSPWRMLAALCPTVWYYNLQLYFQLGFASVGCYLLSRFLGLQKLASIFVALIFPLSPYVLRYLELLGGPIYTMYPWLILVFLRAAERATLQRMALAAAVTALLLFTGHTLLATAGILTASLLFVLFSIFVYGRQNEPSHGRIEVIRAFSRIALIGVLSFLFASPVIFPFLEFAQNTICYKFKTAQSIAPWQTMPYLMMHPGLAEWSATIGILALPLIVCGWFASGQLRKKYLVILVSSACIYLVMSAPGPLAYLFSFTPLRFIPSAYYSYMLLLLLAICAGFGIESIGENGFSSKKKLICTVSMLLFAIFFPLFLHLAKVDLKGITFDEQLPATIFRFKFWICDVIVGSLFVAGIFLLRFNKIPKLALTVAAIALALVSELNVSRLSLPPTPPFDFVKTPAHQFLADCGERVSPQGFDLLAANANAVYGIRSIAIHNPMLVRRYVDFMNAAKTHVDDFNVLVEHPPHSKLLDISSLKYIISLAPVISEDEVFSKQHTIRQNATTVVNKDLSLESSEVVFKPAKKEILGTLVWKSAAADRERYRFIVDVVDENGKPFWYSGPAPCFEQPYRDSKFNLKAFLPASVKSGQRFIVGVRVFDTQKAAFVPLANGGDQSEKFAATNNEIVLAAWNNEIPSGTQDRFKLVKELSGIGARIYENTTALPQAYLVRHILPVASPDEALAALKNLRTKTEALRDQAIVEIDKPTMAPLKGADRQLFSSPLQPDSAVKGMLSKLEAPGSLREQTVSALPSVKRPTVNRVVVDCNCTDLSFLVLTDLYYPGWTVSVDGVEAPVYCSNYAFRGVPLAPGKHQVIFNFHPASFYFGIYAALGSLALILLMCVLGNKKSRPGS